MTLPISSNIVLNYGVLLSLIVFKPFKSSHVRKMGDLEIREYSLESVTIRTCRHHSNHYRCIVLQPAVSHHCIFLVVE